MHWCSLASHSWILLSCTRSLGVSGTIGAWVSSSYSSQHHLTSKMPASTTLKHQMLWLLLESIKRCLTGEARSGTIFRVQLGMVETRRLSVSAAVSPKALCDFSRNQESKLPSIWHVQRKIEGSQMWDVCSLQTRCLKHLSLLHQYLSRSLPRALVPPNSRFHRMLWYQSKTLSSSHLWGGLKSRLVRGLCETQVSELTLQAAEGSRIGMFLEYLKGLNVLKIKNQPGFFACVPPACWFAMGRCPAIQLATKRFEVLLTGVQFSKTSEVQPLWPRG